MTPKTLARAAALVLVLAVPIGAQITDFEAQRKDARLVLIEGLRDHATWCKNRKLFLSRERTLERLLLLEPDDPEARRALRYSKQRDGTWAPPRKPKKYRDFDGVDLGREPTHYAAAIAPYIERMRSFLHDSEIAADQRLLVVDGILLADPNDAELRAEQGEVKVDATWILRETSVSVARRAKLEDEIGDALASDALVEASDIADRELAFALNWSKAYSTPNARVVGTVAENELYRMARAIGATIATFRSVLGEAALPEGTTIFVLQGPQERDTFLDSHPELEDAKRENLRATAGGWVVGSNDIAYWAEKESQRLDGIVRMVLAYLIGDAFGVTLTHHWVHEGFGLYLTDALIGTRMTWFVQPLDEYGPDSLQEEMLDSVNWKRLTFDVLSDGERPRLRALIAKPAAEYDTIDLLYTFVVAAYLIEGYPDRVSSLLKALGAGRASERAIPECVGFRLGDIDARILRWLEETTAVEDGELKVSRIAASAKDDE